MPAQKNGLLGNCHCEPRRGAAISFIKLGLIFLISLFLLNSNFTPLAFASSGRPPITFIFSGRVLDSQTQQPLANVSLSARVLLDNTTFSASTDTMSGSTGAIGSGATNIAIYYALAFIIKL